MNDKQTEFLNAITSHQIVPAATLHFVLDGSIHRFSDKDKPKGKTCWYIAYDGDYPTIVFGNWRQSDARYTFTLNGEKLTPEARTVVDKQIKEAQAKAAEERKKMASNAALECQRIYNDAVDATLQHAYFKAKNVTHSEAIKGIKQSSKGNLLIPVMNVKGEVRSLQTISEQGSKRFYPGGEKKGNFFVIGEVTDKIYICEGVATGLSIFEATSIGVVVAFDTGGLMPVAKNINAKYPDKTIIIAADNDHCKEVNAGLEAAKKAATEVGLSYCYPRFTEAEIGSDFNDLAELHGASRVAEDLQNVVTKNVIKSNDKKKNNYALNVISIVDLLKTNLPPRENLLNPWLPKQGLAMIHAPRGVGKTFVGLNVAYAVASGGDYLGWNAPKASEVLYLDGEMPGVVMKERLARIVADNDEEAVAPFQILTPDLQPGIMPDLSLPEYQQEIESHLENINLIVVDNISTLCRSGKENEAEGWLPVQAWALRMRAKGISVVFIHHTGKGGKQRGTSKREDVLDTVISLRRPKDYEPEQGACFEIHFEKSRGFYGRDAEPLSATLVTDGVGSQQWKIIPLEKSTYEKVVELIGEGLNQNEVAKELELNRSTVHRHVKKAKAEGLLP